VRIPASLCGLLGIKPTNGVFGRWPAPDWIDYSTDGCLATASDDLRLLYTVQRGPVHGDPTAPAYAMVNAMTATPPSRLVAATRTSDLGPLPADVDRAFRDAVDAASALFGLPVTWIDPGSLFTNGDPDLDWFTVTTAEHVASLGRDFVEAHWDDFHPATQEYLAVGRTIAIDAYLAARRRRYGYVRALDDLLGTDGLLLTPTVASSGFLADGRLDVDAPVTGLPPQVYSTALQNVTGHPALSVPFGTLATGLPFGLQFTAPRYADLTLLDVADAWERAYPWPRTAPGYTGLDEALGL
jgi:amidase/aspartyl-tRNA(Asn)/glutamyl-tRNA(Gln) amidotransferase subunit A